MSTILCKYYFIFTARWRLCERNIIYDYLISDIDVPRHTAAKARHNLYPRVYLLLAGCLYDISALANGLLSKTSSQRCSGKSYLTSGSWTETFTRRRLEVSEPGFTILLRMPCSRIVWISSPGIYCSFVKLLVKIVNEWEHRSINWYESKSNEFLFNAAICQYKCVVVSPSRNLLQWVFSAPLHK